MNWNRPNFTVVDAPIVKVAGIHPRGLFLNAYPFWRHLHTYDAVDATTFTLDTEATATIALRRVVFTRSDSASKCKDVELRRCANMHAKLFLCYNAGKLAAVFAGSWNLVNPTWMEVVASVAKKNWKDAAAWFEAVWIQSKPVNDRVRTTVHRKRVVRKPIWSCLPVFDDNDIYPDALEPWGDQ